MRTTRQVVGVKYVWIRFGKVLRTGLGIFGGFGFGVFETKIEA